ncbi:hypothetical protein NNRS527_02720 [Nitrosospira sp. NRS527]|nr:hypothetical protein NNRS527_02720 [Nitrosospira sp. NRS527]
MHTIQTSYPLSPKQTSYPLSPKTHIFMPQDEETIISFSSSSPQLREMCIQESSSDVNSDHVTDQQVFNIRMVNSEGRREAASLLIRKRYGWRGYSIDPFSDNEPNRIILVADTEGKTVATMTLCLDADIGLPADENFRDKLDELRLRGRRLSEPSRLAIEDNIPKRVFASLIHISYIYAHNIFGFTDWVIEVNPRHAMFYKKMLGFENFGEKRVCTRVNAPAVLLRLKLEYMSGQIRKFGGLMEQHGQEKSFYPYFFSPRDELGITGRLETGRT